MQSWVTQPDADGVEEGPQQRCSCERRKRFVEHLTEFTSEWFASELALEAMTREPVSYMSQQDLHTAQMHHTKKVFSVIFPTND